MKTLRSTGLSMLDLVAVREGGSVAEALAIALRTAQHAETLGFTRYWLAEHHNMPGIASSATAAACPRRWKISWPGSIRRNAPALPISSPPP